MTHQQMIDYWESELNNNEEKIKDGISIHGKVMRLTLRRYFHIILSQLRTMEFEQPKVSTSTDYFTKPCDHNFDITGIMGFRCMKCGAHPGDLHINAKNAQCMAKISINTLDPEYAKLINENFWDLV